MLQKIFFALLFSFLTAFAFISTASAQEQTLETDAKKAAKEICGCMNLFFDALHPALLDLMNDMIEVGEEQAQANFATFLSNASTEEQAQILKDIERMEDIEIELEAFCGEVQERFSSYDDSEEFEIKMISHLSELPECKLVYSMMKIGEEGEDE